MKGVQFPERIRRLEPISNRFSAFRLRAEQCDVLFASYSAGMSIEPHTHDTENWDVVTRGELILDVQGHEARLRPGDRYHVPAHAGTALTSSVIPSPSSSGLRPKSDRETV